MRNLLAAAAVLYACASASAQDREIVIAGAGATPCSSVLKTYREGPKALSLLFLSYAQGFWTGQNALFMQARSPMVRNLAGDANAQLKALMDECSRRPSEDFGIIVRDIFYKLPNVSKAN